MYQRHFGPEGITELSRAEATTDRVRQEAPPHRYLHLATHGFSASEGQLWAPDEGLPQQSPLGDRLTRLKGISHRHPGLLSALVLAGPTSRLPKSRREVPPWRRTYWEVLKSGLGLAAMGSGELLTKLAFFGRRPLRRIAQRNRECVG